MNTIQDINSPGDVSYNQQSLYSITFGNSLGAGNTVVDSGFTYQPLKQVPITALSNCVRDVLIDFNFGATAVVSTIDYTGPNANLGVLQIAPNAWRAYGVRTIAAYDEIFANTSIKDLAVSNSYSYNTVVLDQAGNTRTWSTAVTTRANPAISLTGNVIYDEGINRTLTEIGLTNSGNATGNYTVQTSIATPAIGTLSNIIVTGSTVQTRGNVTSLTAQIAAGNVIYVPATDLASNVASGIQVSLQRSFDLSVVSTANINLQIGNVNPEFALTQSRTLFEDLGGAIAAHITDNDPVNTTYRVRYVQTAPVPTDPTDTCRIFSDGILPAAPVRNGDTGYLTTTRSVFNAFLPIENAFYLVPPIDYVGNITILYNQEKFVGNTFVTQAANVPVAISIVGHNETNPVSVANYSEGSIVALANSFVGNPTGSETNRGMITDLSYSGIPEPITYVQTWTQVTPDPAVYQARWFNSSTANLQVASGWSARGVANVVRSGTREAANQLNIAYTPPLNYTGNIVLRFDQTKNQEGNTFIQSSNVQFTMQNSGNTTVFTCNPPTTGFILNSIPFSNVSLTDNDTLAERLYTLNVSVLSGNANITINGSNVGTTANISGNKSTVNSSVASANSFITASSGNSSIQYTLTRTAPDTTQINQTTKTLTMTVPAAGTAWRGGIMIGEYDPIGNASANVYLVAQTNATVFSPFLTHWAANGVANSTPINSTKDGKTNTTVLVANNAAIYTAANTCDSAVLNGFNDWFLPSIEQLQFIANVKITNSIADLGLYFPSGPVSGSKYWSSTVKDHNFGAGNVRVVDRMDFLQNGNTITTLSSPVRIDLTDPESGNASVSYVTCARQEPK